MSGAKSGKSMIEQNETMQRVAAEIKMRAINVKPRNNYVACAVINTGKMDTIVLPENVSPATKVDGNLFVLAVPETVTDLKPGDRISSVDLRGGCLTMKDAEYGEILFIEQHRIIAVEKR